MHTLYRLGPHTHPLPHLGTLFKRPGRRGGRHRRRYGSDADLGGRFELGHVLGGQSKVRISDSGDARSANGRNTKNAHSSSARRRVRQTKKPKRTFYDAFFCSRFIFLLNGRSEKKNILPVNVERVLLFSAFDFFLLPKAKVDECCKTSAFPLFCAFFAGSNSLKRDSLFSFSFLMEKNRATEKWPFFTNRTKFLSRWGLLLMRLSFFLRAWFLASYGNAKLSLSIKNFIDDFRMSFFAMLSKGLFKIGNREEEEKSAKKQRNECRINLNSHLFSFFFFLSRLFFLLFA